MYSRSCYCSQFEDMKVNFHMEKLSVAIKDNKDKDEIIRLTVGELKSTLTQRPGAQAIKLVYFNSILLVVCVRVPAKNGRLLNQV